MSKFVAEKHRVSGVKGKLPTRVGNSAARGSSARRVVAPPREFPHRCGNSPTFESHLYRPALPFEIHEAGDAWILPHRFPYRGESEGWSLARQLDDLPAHAIEIANKALCAGLRLSFVVAAEVAVHVTAVVACKLSVPVYALYDQAHQRLILRAQEKVESSDVD